MTALSVVSVHVMVIQIRPVDPGTITQGSLRPTGSMRGHTQVGTRDRTIKLAACKYKFPKMDLTAVVFYLIIQQKMLCMCDFGFLITRLHTWYSTAVPGRVYPPVYCGLETSISKSPCPHHPPKSPKNGTPVVFTPEFARKSPSPHQNTGMLAHAAGWVSFQGNAFYSKIRMHSCFRFFQNRISCS